MRYTEEKALYLAKAQGRLHLDYYEEQRDTTLWKLAQKARKEGHMVPLAEDDSGYYYGITQAGEIRLLELQIKWRESRGKDATERRAQLSELRKTE